jgi:hypothetical protein
MSSASPYNQAGKSRSRGVIASFLLATVFVSALPSDAPAWGGNQRRWAGPAMGMNAGPGMQRSNWGRGGQPMMMRRGHGFHGGRAVGLVGAIALAAMANQAAQAAPPEPMPRGERLTLKKSSSSKVAGKPAQDNKTKQLVKRPPLKNLKDLAKKAPDNATAANCPDCKPVLNSVARLEDGLKQDEARLAALKEYKARHENELTTMTDPGMRAAHEEVIRNAETGIQETQDLINLVNKVLEERRTQAKEKIATHHPAPPPPPPAPVTNEPGYGPPAYTQPPYDDVPRRRLPPTWTSSTPSTPTPTETQTTGVNVTPGQDGKVINECSGHVAELTNGNRVFHRLYAVTPGPWIGEIISWALDKKLLQSRLEAPGRQAPGSTTRTLQSPTVAQFKQEVKNLQALATGCSEVTIYVSSHGLGGMKEEHRGERSEVDRALEAEMIKTNGEPYAENVTLGDGVLWDEEMGELVRGFAPTVSVTLLMDACWGGGFAGKNQVVESDLVQVIGPNSKCPSIGVFGPTLSNSINEGVDKLADKNGRVTVKDLKDQMKADGWKLGAPYDNEKDL